MKRRDFCLSLAPAALAGIAQGFEAPRPAPDIVINMPNGKAPLRLSQFKGKVIAVEFLLTYCSHCQKASRTTEIMYREYGAKGFAVVGAAINPGGDVNAYARDLNLTFPVGSVAQEVCMSFMQVPMTARLLMPQVAFIDKEFRIAAQYSGDANFFQVDEEKQMREQIEKLLHQGAAPAARRPVRKK
ncbi:MAG: TlpA family protein disulfide reductase [Bryobacterales bacterium]|nr:TlpA family protein disulfide reductase [Bryobacterales bacterium]